MSLERGLDDPLKKKVIPISRGKRAGRSSARIAGNGRRPSFVARIVGIKKRKAVKAVMNALPDWITPNGVTLFGTLCVIPVILLIDRDAYAAALAVFVFSRLLDFVDGALAEVRDRDESEREFGAFLDPFGDKVMNCGTLLMLLPRLPDYFKLPIVTICLVALALTLFRIPKMLRRKQGLTKSAIGAVNAGKVKTITENASVMLLLAIFAAGMQDSALLIVAFVMLFVAMMLGFGSFISQATRQ